MQPVIFAYISLHHDLCNMTNRGYSERQENLSDVSAIPQCMSQSVQTSVIHLFSQFALSVTLTCNINTNIIHCNKASN